MFEPACVVEVSSAIGGWGIAVVVILVIRVGAGPTSDVVTGAGEGTTGSADGGLGGCGGREGPGAAIAFAIPAPHACKGSTL